MIAIATFRDWLKRLVWRSVLVKIQKIFSLLIELFALAVYFIILYIYIVTFCRAFFSLPSMNFWHILQIIFFYNVRIILGTFRNKFFSYCL